MIKATDEGVMIQGETSMVCIDLIMIIRAMRSLMKQEYGDAKADLLIRDLGRIAFLDPNDDKGLEEIINESPLAHLVKETEDHE